jgi:hypothetical protein
MMCASSAVGSEEEEEGSFTSTPDLRTRFEPKRKKMMRSRVTSISGAM